MASTSRTCLVDPGNAEVPVARQRRLLGIPRSSYCYRPRRRRRAQDPCRAAQPRGGPHEEDERVAGVPEAEPVQTDQESVKHVLQSMDGRARRVDNVIVERWFRSLKSECVRICEYETPAELRRRGAGYVEQYNAARPHQSLGHDTPSEWYYSGLASA